MLASQSGFSLPRAFRPHRLTILSNLKTKELQMARVRLLLILLIFAFLSSGLLVSADVQLAALVTSL